MRSDVIDPKNGGFIRDVSTMHDESPQRLTPFAVFAVFVAVFLNVQDGFDILAVSYAANDWGLQRTDLGLVFSASLFGMMVGAMLFGPLADRFERRTIVLVGLFVPGTGMLLAALATNIPYLVAARTVTGLGIGGVLVSMNTLVAEYAGPRYRSLAVALFQLGYPLGGFLARFATATLLEASGWRAVFVFGAALSFVFIPLIFILPESVSYLAKSTRANALDELNKARRRLGYEALDSLPGDTEESGNKARIFDLFSREYVVRTLLIWTAFFCLLLTLYFLLSWTPKILVDVGWSEAEDNRGGRVLNLVGLGGIVLIGLIGLTIKTSLASALYLFGLAASLVVLGQVGVSSVSVFVVLAAVGFFVHGSMIGLYSTVPSLYPARLRATGTGWALGLSRFGAVLGPMLAAALLNASFDESSLFALFAIPSAIAAIAMIGLRRMQT